MPRDPQRPAAASGWLLSRDEGAEPAKGGGGCGREAELGTPKAHELRPMAVGRELPEDPPRHRAAARPREEACEVEVYLEMRRVDLASPGE